MNKQSIIVYDLETQKTFAEVGANRNDQLRVSFLGLYSFSQNKYFSFYEADLPKLELILQAEQPTIVGFNSISFDNKVLQPYFKQLQIATLPQIDILDEIYSALGYRMKLESVAQSTLGEGKSGTGLDAIRYFRTGNFEALAKYCLDDVRITRDLYLYGLNHGFLLYHAAGEVRRVPITWGNSVTITDQLKQAWQTHRCCSISYLQLEPTKQTIATTIDILSFSPNTIQAFCHSTNCARIFEVARILSLEVKDEQYAYQATLI